MTLRWLKTLWREFILSRSPENTTFTWKFYVKFNTFLEKNQPFPFELYQRNAFLMFLCFSEYWQNFYVYSVPLKMKCNKCTIMTNKNNTKDWYIKYKQYSIQATMISRENLFYSMCDQQKLWSIYTFMQSTDVEWLLSYLTNTPAGSAEEPPKTVSHDGAYTNKVRL